jgi:hypothetical protein
MKRKKAPPFSQKLLVFITHLFIAPFVLCDTKNELYNKFDASKDLVKIRGYPLVSVKTLQSTKIVFEQLTSGNEQLTINIAPRGKRTLAVAPSYRLDTFKTQKGGRISIDTDDYRDQLKPDTPYEISVKSATNNRRQEIFVRTPTSLDLSTITTREYVGHVSVEWQLVDNLFLGKPENLQQQQPEEVEILVRKERPESYDDEESEGDVRVLRVPFKPVRKRYGNARRSMNLDIDQLMPNSVYYLALRYNYERQDDSIVVSDYTAELRVVTLARLPRRVYAKFTKQYLFFEMTMTIICDNIYFPPYSAQHSDPPHSESSCPLIHFNTCLKQQKSLNNS